MIADVHFLLDFFSNTYINFLERILESYHINYFYSCCEKIPKGSSLKKKELALTHRSRVQAVMEESEGLITLQTKSESRGLSSHSPFQSVRDFIPYDGTVYT